MNKLVEKVNSEHNLGENLDRNMTIASVPVMATPAIAVTAAKVAGAAIGAGAVTGAAYAAYRAVAR